MRADARRSYEHLLAAAADVFAEQGTTAALDDIAKRAAIGNATLYRHFPTRQDLVQALLADRYDALRLNAERLLTAADPRAALAEWLRTFIAHVTAYRGLPASVMDTLRNPETEMSVSCQRMRDAAAKLLARAQAAAVMRSDLTITELLCLTNGVAVAAERRQEETARLLSLLIEGLQAGLPAAVEGGGGGDEEDEEPGGRDWPAPLRRPGTIPSCARRCDPFQTPGSPRSGRSLSGPSSGASCEPTWTPPSPFSSVPSSSASAPLTCRKSGVRSRSSSAPSLTGFAPGNPGARRDITTGLPGRFYPAGLGVSVAIHGS
jgi:AcrR family transcriptional regulator